MAAFRIRYKQWVRRPELNNAEGPFFKVYPKEEGPPVRCINVLLGWADIQSLKHEMRLQKPEKDVQFKRVVIRYAIQRIEQELKQGSFSNPSNGITDNLFITRDEHPMLRELSQEKTCAYQIKEVTGLLCSASCPEDETARSHREFQVVAPTTQALCRACDLPDTDYLCSHFAYPEVLGHRDRGAIVVRQLANGLCNIDRSEVRKHPEYCRADGHECWVRFIEFMQEPLPIPASPALAPVIHVQEGGIKEPMPKVFTSYVRENSEEVTQLVDVLKAHEIDVWLDKTHLKPGDRWANVIRREISQGDFFIACFSIEYSKRRKSYMNEEIIQAIEQLRQRPVDQP